MNGQVNNAVTTQPPSAEAAPAPSKQTAPRIDVTVSISEDDLIAFNHVWVVMSGERGRAVWMARAWSVLPIAGGGAIIVLGDYILGGALLALGLFLALAAGPYYRAATRRAVERQLESRNPVMLGTRRIVIDKTGVFDGGRYDRMQVAWPAVVSLVRASGALYIFYGSMQAVIVPRRAFRESNEYDRMIAVTERFAGRHAQDQTKVR